MPPAVFSSYLSKSDKSLAPSFSICDNTSSFFFSDKSKITSTASSDSKLSITSTAISFAESLDSKVFLFHLQLLSIQEPLFHHVNFRIKIVIQSLIKL